MSNKLQETLSALQRQDYSTKAGRDAHLKMQQITIDGPTVRGDTGLCAQILSRPELIPFFATTAQTEVPIAGYLNKQFVSRRIDRMIINNADKTVKILDYKTDINKLMFRDKYFNQLSEYTRLLSEIYPSYKISAYILWLHDFELEQLI